MKIKMILILSLLAASISTPSLGKEIKTKLTLFKSIEDYRTIIMKGRLCKTFLYSKKTYLV